MRFRLRRWNWSLCVSDKMNPWRLSLLGFALASTANAQTDNDTAVRSSTRPRFQVVNGDTVKFPTADKQGAYAKLKLIISLSEQRGTKGQVIGDLNELTTETSRLARQQIA